MRYAIPWLRCKFFQRWRCTYLTRERRKDWLQDEAKSTCTYIPMSILVDVQGWFNFASYCRIFIDRSFNWFVAHSCSKVLFEIWFFHAQVYNHSCLSFVACMYLFERHNKKGKIAALLLCAYVVLCVCNGSSIRMEVGCEFISW
jgi:hypothetical protein